MQMKEAHAASICDLRATLEAAAAEREALTFRRCAALEATCQDLRQSIAALNVTPEATAWSLGVELREELHQIREENTSRVAELRDETNHAHQAMLFEVRPSLQSAAAEHAASHEAQLSKVRASLEIAALERNASLSGRCEALEVNCEHLRHSLAKVSAAPKAATQALGRELRLELQQLRKETDQMVSQLRDVLALLHEYQLTEFHEPLEATAIKREAWRSAVTASSCVGTGA